MLFRIPCKLLLGGAIAALVAGCFATRPHPRPANGEVQRMTTSPARTTAARETTPPIDLRGDLVIEQAIAAALLGSPELTTFSHAVRAAEARIIQARLLPNPEIELAIEEFNRDNAEFGSAELAIVLSQLIELGGKRKWRARMAEAEGELAGWDYEIKRLDVLTSTIKRFAGVVAAQQRVDLARLTVDLAGQTSAAVAERVKAGREPPLQASKALAELGLAKLDLEAAAADLRTSMRLLAAMWGGEQAHFGSARGDLSVDEHEIPPLAILRARLLRHPELARFDAELRLSRASLSSEQAARVPDAEASVAVIRFQEDGTDALAFGLGMPLPLFDRNQGNIAAARHELARAEEDRRRTEMSLAVSLAEAHAALTLAGSRVATLRSEVVPAMEEAFEAARTGYAQGKFGFLDMLDAQRTLFETRAALVDATYAYHTALADVQAISGTPIDTGLIPREED